MTFRQFIRDHLEQIVALGEAFARTLLPAAKSMSVLVLRDYRRAVLLAIADDMDMQ